MKLSRCQRVSGIKLSGCRYTSITVFAYDDMLHRGYYSTNEQNYMEKYYYRDWPLYGVTLDLYRVDSSGNKTYIKSGTTNSSGYVTFDRVDYDKTYYVDLDTSSINASIRNYIKPNVENKTFKITKYSDPNTAIQRGWYYDANYHRMIEHLNGGYDCISSSGTCQFDLSYFPCCICGNMWGASLSNWYNIALTKCGFRQTNINSASSMGVYSGVRVMLEPSILLQHAYAFDIRWTCYAYNGATFNYSTERLCRGLVMMLNGNNDTAHGSYLDSSAALSKLTYFSNKNTTNGSVGSINYIDIVSSCHIYITGPYQSRFANVVIAQIESFMLYMSMQSH